MLATAVFAQSEPPVLIRIARMHTKLNQAPLYAGVYAGARPNINVVGMSSITGMPENRMLEFCETFEGVEVMASAWKHFGAERDSDPGADGVMPGSSAFVAQYRSQFGYRPGEAIKQFPSAKYVSVSAYRVRPGGESEFDELAKQRRGGFESINLDRPEMAYQVISGSPGTLWFFISPLPSLRALDQAVARLHPWMVLERQRADWLTASTCCSALIPT